ncbi:DUF7094 domain-containing protein [Halorussus marinus]|uniref:DUF7094 domain-containing protein n=1 Tax=Halorussus marinus TaxID=2505976 RepID=UPI00106E4DE6|nr:hypothetical protein [Halorussus marinus]
MRVTPVMLALLLALSPGAAAVQAAAPLASAADDRVGATDVVRPATNENTTAVLTLGADPDRTAFDSASVSLGRALAADRASAETALSVGALDEKLAAAGSDRRRKQILTRYRYRIENHVISLRSAEQRATEAFSNGSLSATAYLRTLGRIDAEAEHVRHTVRELQTRAQKLPDFGMLNVDTSVQVRLMLVEGPVRDRISKSLRGTRDPIRVHVSTAGRGVALSAIRDGEYVREIARPDRRDSGTTESLTVGRAFNLVLDQYPWVRNNTAGGSSSQYSPTDVYDVTVNHNHGNFTASLDAGTGEIFKEIQYKRLEGQRTLPPGPGVRNTAANAFGTENVTLTVNRTYPGGPLRAHLANETGAPLDGTITVDGEPVGATGSDGVLWTLGPDEQFRVSATHDGTTVNVTATPVDIRSAEG